MSEELLEEYQGYCSMILHAHWGDVDARLIGLLDWLEANEFTGSILSTIRDSNRLKDLLQDTTYNNPPLASTPKDIALIGLHLMDEVKNGKNMFNLSSAYGIHPEYNTNKAQDMVNAVVERFISPTLEYIERQMMKKSAKTKNIKNERIEFLRAIYGIVGFNIQKPVNVNKIGDKLGLEPETLDGIIQYLENEKFIKMDTFGGFYTLTHLGLKEVERDEGDDVPLSGVHHLSGDFRGAIVNIDSQTTNAKQSAGYYSNIQDDKKAEELAALIEELKNLLEQVSADRQHEVDTITWAVEELVKATTSETPNPVKIEITKEGLLRAAENIARVMPAVVAIAEKIINLLIN